MEEKLSDLIDSLEVLKKTIDDAKINANGFQQHAWNQIHLKKEDVSYYIDNFINKLKAYGDTKLTESLLSTIESHIQNLTVLNKTSKAHFLDQAPHLIHMVPVILVTLNTIFSDIEFELFSYENIQDNKLLPKALSNRLRGISTQIDSFDTSCDNLSNKISTINSAHEAAESLPTDLASLQEAKEQLDALLKDARQELGSYKNEIDTVKSEIFALNRDAKKHSEDAENFKNKAQQSSQEATSLVEECDDALQITTTQGLAAGFDQKAKELKNSIWVWIIGLLLALGVGAWIGADRVSAFTQAIQSELTVGQAILHTIMSIFSIGGPLWLAWISTQQINQRFKLSEDYSYKATVAKAFTGFSKFAERYDQATEERLFNSTLDRLDEMPLRLVEGKDYNSPWHEFIDSEAFKKALDMVPNLANEAGRFANQTKLKKKPKQANRASDIDSSLAEVEQINNREESA